MKLALHLIRIISIAAFLVIAGCASTPKPPTAQISLNAQKNINPYTDGITTPESRPVVIRVYELKSLATFNKVDFFSAFNNYKETLDSELLNSEEFQLTPGMKLKLDRTLHLDTRYVGVISAFRDLEHSQWRVAAAIPPEESNIEIHILLEGNRVLIGARPECSFFCWLWSPKPPAGSIYEIIERQSE